MSSNFWRCSPILFKYEAWYNEFNCGRRSLTNENREGRPIAVVLENMMCKNKYCNILM